MSSWINTVSLEHVERGVAGGSTQADHGRDTRLRRLRRGDALVCYSPRTAMRSGASLQQFTAIAHRRRRALSRRYDTRLPPLAPAGRLRRGEPGRRPPAAAAAVVRDRRAAVGAAVPRGLFEVDDADLAVIAAVMGARLRPSARAT
jgi:hypothetical protein